MATDGRRRTYAEDTRVSVSRSQEETVAILERYGVDGIGMAWQRDRAMVEFVYRGRRIRFGFALPVREEGQAEAAWEQAKRARWRAGVLAIKSKLVAVDTGIVTFEQEFLAYTVLSSGETVGEHVEPIVARSVATGRAPELLPGTMDEEYR